MYRGGKAFKNTEGKSRRLIEGDSDLGNSAGLPDLNPAQTDSLSVSSLHVLHLGSGGFLSQS